MSKTTNKFSPEVRERAMRMRHSVLDLLRIRHEKMSRNPAQCVDYGSYAPDAFMKIARARNWNINAVLPAGKALLLHNTKTRTVHDRIEITNRLPNRMKDQIIKASTCTGLRFAAVDAIVTPNGKVFILEVNAKPGFAPHSFPLDDQWNLHIPEAIIRWHFPELRDPIRRVRNYDFVGLLRDFQKQPDRDRFNVADYIALE